ncbi:hypothetical protein B0F90DRAFT_1022554 [Multifurca ochricompacta]|uniref:Uncharacterized protein n=1 Tax=Multifurca ochricompacta TaxID=376703 RepID=A0AAD4LZE3_9AGAM|nr:hypothetical protein B0F90DRAFT_1022554 [Multifurca ochricompacta]
MYPQDDVATTLSRPLSRFPLGISGTGVADLPAHVPDRTSNALEAGQYRLLSDSRDVAAGYCEYYLTAVLPLLDDATVGISNMPVSAATLTSAALLDVGAFREGDHSPLLTGLTLPSLSSLARASLAATLHGLLCSPHLLSHMDQPCDDFTDAVSFSRHITRPATHRDHLRFMCQQLATLLAPSNVDTPLGLYQSALNSTRITLNELALADASAELATSDAYDTLCAEVLAEARSSLKAEFLATADKFWSDTFVALQGQARQELSAEVLAWRVQYKQTRLAQAQAETDIALAASTPVPFLFFEETPHPCQPPLPPVARCSC